MPDYRDFVKMARERQEKSKMNATRGGIVFTRHAEYKMKQYGLSPQRVRTVMRNPKRREEGIAKDTIAVMQPSSVKRKDGVETWNQEIWVMYVQPKTKDSASGDSRYPLPGNCFLRVISAWRYPGVSPKRNPVPEEILREIEEGSILEEADII